MALQNKKERYLPIENYGVIGNLHTVALVSQFASIDFMCFPRFDSPTIFCRLLDSEKGGFFSIDPQMKDAITKQLYLLDTNVLVTRFLSEDGIAEIIDYMPIENSTRNCSIVRRISTIRGTIQYKVRCSPRFNYAATAHKTEQLDDGWLFTPEDDSGLMLSLRSEHMLQAEGTDVVSLFELEEGQSTCFVLEIPEAREHLAYSLQEFAERTYHGTISYWQSWIARSNYNGYWQEMVKRSALTLKLLISETYGSMIAAPTFSLPESIGDERNWDYRYTWIRDAAFGMHAFLELGFLSEAEQFLEWVKKQSAKKELQLMFSIDGNTNLTEHCLDYLDGYKGSKPVRIGNEAHKQTQMDIYGELLETIYVFVTHGGDITYEYWKIIDSYIKLVLANWHKPDHSIWEVRGERREFLFSRIMCWVAIDRAIKIGDHFSFPYDFLKWHNVRNEIFKDVYDNFWNEEKQAFVQFKGSGNIDASSMLMPILGMISPHSEKWQKTMVAIEQELKTDVLIYRYREKEDEIDGLRGNEGTFTMCSFWYVECLALAGDTQKAREHFEKMLGYANHLGLYAEQLGMKGEHLGNFPQAFTHLALISAAIELDGNRDKIPRHMHNGSNKKK